MKKRALSLLLCIIMVLSLLPTAVLADNNYVAEITGGQKYETLQAAIDAATTEGDVVTLLCNITDTTGVTVPSTANMTLDLGGFTTKTPIRNEGTLTVKNGTVDTWDTYWYDENTGEPDGYNALRNVGTMTVEATVTVKGGWNAITNQGTITIKGGSFTGHIDGLYNEGTATIENGVFTGNGYAGIENYADEGYCDGIMLVKSGTFKGYTAGLGNYGVTIVETGSFIGGDSGAFGGDKPEYDNLSIVSEEYTNADEFYQVDVTKGEATFQVGDVQYAQFDAALTAAKAINGTITVLKDAKANGFSVAGKDRTMTIDLNGHTLQVNGQIEVGTGYSATAGGSLTIMDGTNTDGTVEFVGKADKLFYVKDSVAFLTIENGTYISNETRQESTVFFHSTKTNQKNPNLQVKSGTIILREQDTITTISSGTKAKGFLANGTFVKCRLVDGSLVKYDLSKEQIVDDSGEAGPLKADQTQDSDGMAIQGQMIEVTLVVPEGLRVCVGKAEVEYDLSAVTYTKGTYTLEYLKGTERRFGWQTADNMYVFDGWNLNGVAQNGGYVRTTLIAGDKVELKSKRIQTSAIEAVNGTYTVTTPEEFNYLASLSLNGESFEGKTILIANDLDFSGKGFLPIGLTTVFKGTLDGQNNTIRNVKANGPDYAGIIGKASAPAVVQDLKVADSSFVPNGIMNDDRTYASAIIANAGASTVSGCEVSNVTVNAWFSGALIGHSLGATVTDSSVTESAVSGAKAGGIAGYTDGMTASDITIQNSTMDGALIGQPNSGSMDLENIVVSNVKNEAGKDALLFQMDAQNNGNVTISGDETDISAADIFTGNNTTENVQISITGGKYTLTAEGAQESLVENYVNTEEYDTQDSNNGATITISTYVIVTADKTSITLAQTATLTAALSRVTSGTTYAYQWYKGDSAIPGATEATYQVLGSADPASYSCKVTATPADGSEPKVLAGNTVSIIRAQSASSVTITGKQTAAAVGDAPFTFTYTAEVCGNDVTVASSDPSVATVSDDNGTVTVTILGAGTTEISVSFEGDADYSSASDAFVLTVTAPATMDLTPITSVLPAILGELPFEDVLWSDWFYDEVKEAWEADLIDGMTPTTFEPYGDLTVAQAIKLAAALHQLDTWGKVSLTNGSPNWYDSYVDYAVANGIIEAKYAYYTLAQMNAPVSRREFVHILHGALPASDYVAWNAIADNAIPDVKMGDACAAEIYDFYRAGILNGGKADGSFLPGSNIKRSEVAAILIRMYDATVRLHVSL